MTEALEGIRISTNGDRVVVEVPSGRWEGDGRQTERLLTHLYYVLDRARPGTNIASVFVNGELRGAKVLETDRAAAIGQMRRTVDDLAQHLAKLEDESRAPR